MDQNDQGYWTPPPPARPTSPARRRGRAAAVGVGLVGAGIAAGAIIGTTTGANAASSTPSASASASTGATAPSAGHDRAPMTSGTVTAVTGSTVTIKTSSATTTYAVTSGSDIDKNGEAQLSDLAVGDAVTFDVTTVNGTQTIDKLHAGDEALDRPAAPNASTATTG